MKRPLSSYALLPAALVALTLIACSSDAEPAPEACGVGEGCACFLDSDCPDPSVERCDLFAGECVASGVTTPDAGPDGVADVSEDVIVPDDASTGLDIIRADSAFSDVPTDALVDRNTASCEEICARQAVCGVPDFEEPVCAAECDELQTPIEEFAGQTAEGRDCLEALVLFGGCIEELECEDVLDYSGDNTGEHCGTEDERVKTICGPIVEQFENEEDGSGE